MRNKSIAGTCVACDPSHLHRKGCVGTPVTKVYSIDRAALVDACSKAFQTPVLGAKASLLGELAPANLRSTAKGTEGDGYAVGLGLRLRLSKNFKLDYSIDAAMNDEGEEFLYIFLSQRF